MMNLKKITSRKTKAKICISALRLLKMMQKLRKLLSMKASIRRKMDRKASFKSALRCQGKSIQRMMLGSSLRNQSFPTWLILTSRATVTIIKRSLNKR
jgi:hypothetical protein